MTDTVPALALESCFTAPVGAGVVVLICGQCERLSRTAVAQCMVYDGQRWQPSVQQPRSWFDYHVIEWHCPYCQAVNMLVEEPVA